MLLRIQTPSCLGNEKNTSLWGATLNLVSHSHSPLLPSTLISPRYLEVNFNVSFTAGMLVATVFSARDPSRCTFRRRSLLWLLATEGKKSSITT